VLHICLRKGSANTSRGMLRFTDELIARVDRAGATGPKLLRADSGFWAKKTFDRLDAAGWQFSIGVRLQAYPATSIARIAETTLGDRRLVVRRVRTLDKQGELLPSWEHYPFATNRSDALKVVEAEHRQHVVVELAIRDLKGPSARALLVGQVLRQRRLDRHRRSGAQPAALDQRARAARPHDPRHTHPQTQTAHHARPADQDRSPLDTAPARPLALARRVHRSADAHPRARDHRLTTPLTGPQPAPPANAPGYPNTLAPPAPHAQTRHTATATAAPTPIDALDRPRHIHTQPTSAPPISRTVDRG
jgi:hypothetical protein